MNSTKPTLVYFDHAPHKRTKSTYFLGEILEKDFYVTTIWDDEWDIDSKKTISEINKYDYVVFIQVLPQIAGLRQITAKIIWVPMLDGVIWWPDIRWQLLSTVPLKIISFSRYLAEIAHKWNIDTLSLQFYLNPETIRSFKPGKEINIFFWQRANLTFKTVRQFINPENVNKLIIRLDQSPGIKKYNPDSSDITAYKADVLEGDIGKDMHLTRLKECNIFVAPRYYEGIGWSFIEAMSKGMAVVAFDNPTMNEYIHNGVNGYLINENQTGYLDLSSHIQIGLQAGKDCRQGYLKWKAEQKNIPHFIKAEFRGSSTDHPENELFFRLKYYIYSLIADWKFRRFLSK